MDAKEYKAELTKSFKRNSDHGFVDWSHMGRLDKEVRGILSEAHYELARTKDKDLFDVCCAAFLKWGKTNMDDSSGYTHGFAHEVFWYWDGIYDRQDPDIDHAKMFKWFIKNGNGTVMDYMEEYLMEYLIGHFPEPELQDLKMDFLNEKLDAAQEAAKKDSWKSTEVQMIKCDILKVMIDQKKPIEDIRRYASAIKDDDAKVLLAETELKLGNTERCIDIYERLARTEAKRWGPYKYNLKLKDLYKEYGTRDQYFDQVVNLLTLMMGDTDVLEEYKGFYAAEKWPELRDQLFNAIDLKTWQALPWYEHEGCYDRLMDAIEVCGANYLPDYEKQLSQRYPERCLDLLSDEIEKMAERANNRNGYRKVSKVLKHLSIYPEGNVRASQLAMKLRAKNERKTAFLDELKGI